ncbi:SRPBCC domain-containing protein [Paenibacillus sp. L3-i20]|uniref:SRPBCC family protein n=1 Tax=Paenibacillus sp. L3-i20 TaxID=2905833 RepID=UPI001EDDF692|nr:SRPBCC domain-containing protein [Paenibacillus sp. L3-i20]GKU78900.1 activator of HSP90 ATPase [Paenibacillus sp. L3-i20]
MANQMISKIEGKVIILEREFNASPELVFQAFTQAEHLKQWWGPNGWTIPVCNLDFRVGGAWHYCMKCEDKNQGDFYGMESWGKSVYQEIVAPEKIVYVDSFSDAEGNISKDMPSTIVTLSFIKTDRGTKVVNHAEYVTAESVEQVLAMGMMQGITETWNRLDEHLELIQKSVK